MRKYSDAEVKMFTALGLYDLLDSVLEPPALYRLACEQAFLDNDWTTAAEALRRGANVVLRPGVNPPKRLTEGFDKLIEFKP
jgi:hypothetical protein